MSIFSLFGGNTKNQKVQELLNKGALIIDVRTPAEYSEGHITQSVNIPLNLIPSKINELKRKDKAIITCCRSGARTFIAADQCKKAGIEAENGGPWNSLQQMM